MTRWRAPWIMAVLLVVVVAAAGPSHDWCGVCVRVIDGDTIVVQRGGEDTRVRLYGIDCPEKGQEYGDEAKRFTASLLLGKSVLVSPTDTDRYGRTVASVHLAGLPTSANTAIVRGGYAWWYSEYAPDDDELRDASVQACIEERGLWQSGRPVPPWAYRGDSGTGPNERSDFTLLLAAGTGATSGSPAPRSSYRRAVVPQAPSLPRYRPPTVVQPLPSYSAPRSGRVSVRGYYRKDGTYVRPHTRSYPRRR